MSDKNVIVRILHGYRGVRTNNVYMKPGKHGVDADFAKYLVENGHAEYVDEPQYKQAKGVLAGLDDEPAEDAIDRIRDETPKRKITKRKKTDAKE